MRNSFVLLVFCGMTLFGQDKPASSAAEAPVAPPEVDSALRARINHFYQAHVDGKFRLADHVVADDSKDAFFALPKQRYHSFDIVRINYKDNFQKAEAVVNCLGEWLARGQRMKVNMVATSLWKLENGEWFWYMPPAGPTQTPFGVMHADADPAKPQSETAGQAAAPAFPRDPRAAMAAVLSAVRTDRTELVLSSFEKSAGEVKITNGLQGNVTIRVDIDGQFPGLTFTVDKTDLKANEVATLKIACEPKDRLPKPTVTARVFVDPTNQMLPVVLKFAVPPEIERQIPKELRAK